MRFGTGKQTKKQLKEAYDTISANFDKTRNRDWGEFIFFTDYIKENNLSLDSVLDAGCGNGRLLDYLKQFEFKKYIGFDQSPNLLNLAKQKYIARHPELVSGSHENAQIEFLDASFDSFEQSEKFDAIFSIASIHHLPSKNERAAGLRTLKSLLKPNGVLFLTVWNLDQERYKRFVEESFWRSILKPWYSIRDTLIPFGVNKVKRYYYAYTKKQLEKDMTEAEFDIKFLEHTKGNKISNLHSAYNLTVIAIDKLK